MRTLTAPHNVERNTVRGGGSGSDLDPSPNRLSWNIPCDLSHFFNQT